MEQGESSSTQDLPESFSIDERLVNPQGWLGWLNSLADDVADLTKISQLLLHGSTWSEPDCNSMVASARMAFEKMDSENFCDGRINILVTYADRPNVANFVPITYQQLKDAEAAVQENDRQKILHILAHLGLANLCKMFDINNEGEGNISPATLLSRLLVFAINSYVGAHTEPFDGGWNPEPICLVPGVGLTLRRRSLKCLDSFLHCSLVWVFEEIADNMAVENDQLYLSTTIEEFANIWGPLWEIRRKPSEVAEEDGSEDIVMRYDAGSGHIIRWPHSNEDPELRSSEIFAHWTNNEDDLTEEPLLNPGQRGVKFLIGASKRFTANDSPVG